MNSFVVQGDAGLDHRHYRRVTSYASIMSMFRHRCACSRKASYPKNNIIYNNNNYV